MRFAGGLSVVVAAILALPSVGLAARPRALQQGYGPVSGVAAGMHRAAAPVAAGGGGLLLLGSGLKRAAERE